MSFANRLALALIKIYRNAVSPYLIPCCRFTPTCSEYARQAFVKYGFFYATYLTMRRIIRCNPFHKGGKDELP